MKKILVFITLLFGTLMVAACGGSTENNVDNVPDDQLREFTLSELAQYDGREGRDAYIAVDGFVYDVSNSSRWVNGNHQGQHQAGQDLTAEMNASPHGRAVLSRVPRIGILVDED